MKYGLAAIQNVLHFDLVIYIAFRQIGFRMLKAGDYILNLLSF